MSRMPNQQPDHINETNYNTVLGGLLQRRLPGWEVKPQSAITAPPPTAGREDGSPTCWRSLLIGRRWRWRPSTSRATPHW